MTDLYIPFVINAVRFLAGLFIVGAGIRAYVSGCRIEGLLTTLLGIEVIR